jgi:DNA-3-methyladenine glycosylase I
MSSRRKSTRRSLTTANDETILTNEERPKSKRAKAKKSADIAPTKKTIPWVVEDGKPWYTFYTKGDSLYDEYMANEWGFEKPWEDHLYFEKLSLEGAQSGLSWRTILYKREAYRSTFHNFDPLRVSKMSTLDIEAILSQPVSKDTSKNHSIVVRHRGKIESVLQNACCILQMSADHGTCDDPAIDNAPKENVFAHFLWSFVNFKPILYRHPAGTFLTQSKESHAMSQGLKARGFKFVGPTTCFAMMQATGMVIDHPYDTPEWSAAYQRLQECPGGYQEATS